MPAQIVFKDGLTLEVPEDPQQVTNRLSARSTFTKVPLDEGEVFVNMSNVAFVQGAPQHQSAQF
jgi:hypothetical protein